MPQLKAFLYRIGALRALPATFLAVVVLVDLADGPHQNILGELAIVPLIAATLLGARRTALYGVAAVAISVGLGFYNHAYKPEQLAAQIERLVIIAGCAVVGVAMAGARATREDRLRSITSIAETVQQVLLPQPPAQLGDCQLAARYRAAVNDAHVGGDFYDVRQTRWGIRVLIGDVRGKGLDAVRMAGVMMAAFRERADERPTLSALLSDLDRAVQREATNDEEFVTVILAEIDEVTQVLRVAAAGHPPMLLVRGGGGKLLEDATAGLPLGLGLGALTAAIHEEHLQPSDRLLFYTDGTTEARSDTGEFFPLLDRAPSIIAGGTIDEAVDGLQAALQEWTGDSLRDDAALLAVEIGVPQIEPSADALPASRPAPSASELP